MDRACDSLWMLARKISLVHASCLETCMGDEITPAQGIILVEIERRGTVSMQGLADELRVDTSTFSRRIKSLIGKGLIVRRISAEDRRVTLLEMTREGESLLDCVRNRMNEWITGFFAGMTPFERDVVARSVERLSAEAERDHERGGRTKSGEAGTRSEGWCNDKRYET